MNNSNYIQHIGVEALSKKKNSLDSAASDKILLPVNQFVLISVNSRLLRNAIKSF